MPLHSTGNECALSSCIEGLVEQNLARIFAPEPVKKPLTPGLNAMIEGCAEKVKRLAKRLACRSYDARVEAEDLFSIGMLEICEELAAGRLASMRDPGAYLYRVAYHAMCAELRRVCGEKATSLDVPFTNESGLCLGDVLEAPAAPAAEVGVSERERALHQAISRLPASQRAAVKHRAGLPGYGAHTLSEAAQALRAKRSAAHSADYRGRRKLAQDEGLRQAVGLEVAQ
jgi:RNA polymerase sigma factor (sigma-70 family)